MVRAFFGVCGGFLALALPWPPEVFGVLPGLAALLLGAGVGLAIRFGFRRLVLPACAAFGLLWGWVSISGALEARVATCADADYRLLTVEVAAQPHRRPAGGPGRDNALLEVRVLESPAAGGACIPVPGSRLRLSWYEPPVLASGQRWLLSVRVRAPWGHRNSAGFDYERWLLGRGVAGTGYVRSGTLLEDAPPIAGGFRGWLRDRGVRHSGLILALTEGDRSGVSRALWDVLRTTGTVHLLVVSGLHVGLVCGATFALCAWVLRLPGLFRPIPTEPAAALLALTAAGWYVVSSGCGVPALRAWLMAAGVLLLRVSGWRCAPGALLLMALTAVLLVDPLVVHQQGAYLSFAAVAMLLVDHGANTLRAAAVSRLMRAQLVLFLGLSPLLAVQQGAVPGAGVLANLAAVPLLTLLLPMLLIAMGCWQFLPALASLLVTGGELLLELLLAVLDAASVSPVLVAPSAAPMGSVLTLAAGLLLLTGRDTALRVLLVPAWLVWLIPVGSSVPDGGFRVTALDVGQGSAVLVDTRGHRLLFDSGPAFPGGLDLGAAAVVPSVRATGPGTLDALVLSHEDVDHTGGAVAVLDGLRVEQIFSSFRPRDASLGRPRVARAACEDSVRWQWDGVDFRFLHPRAASGHSAAGDNDRSCVLRVSNGFQTLLLAGDISRRVERRLVRRSEESLAADVITAPHHGSNTSSSRRWLAATRPRIVLVSAPRRSRYGHPHPAVLTRYELVGARVYVTGLHGALDWESWRPDRVRSRRGEGAYWVNRIGASDARARPDG